ncbi:hypothetical protein PQR75_35065 [Paraburkholderia fungorum]
MKYVANTHWHWDHTDGNAWLHEAGATIVPHKHTFKHLTERPTSMRGTERSTPCRKAHAQRSWSKAKGHFLSQEPKSKWNISVVATRMVTCGCISRMPMYL